MYLLVEPHPDDVALSFHFLAMRMAKKGKVFVLSVFGNDERNSIAYCEEMGFTFVGCLCSEEFLHFKEDRILPNIIKKKKHPYRYQVKVYSKRHGVILENIADDLADYKDARPYRTVVCCIGILHPWHVITRLAVDRVFGGKAKLRYYADSPYQFRQYGKMIIEDSGLEVKKTCSKGGEEVKGKFSIFRRCYPSEAGLLKFEKQYFMETPEAVYG